MNNEQQELLDEAYKNYVKSFFKGELKENYEGGGYDFDDYYHSIIDVQNLLGWPQDGPISQKEFINKCKTEEALSIKWIEEYGDLQHGSKEEIEHLSKHYKTDPEFSNKWGLKIEERELSEDDRGLLLQPLGLDPLTKEGRDRLWKENNLPTRLITITYNDKTIETYD